MLQICSELTWQKDLAGMLTTFAEDFRNLPVSQQKAKLMEVLQEIKIYRDKTMEIGFREKDRKSVV
jgi:hypothetical protein